MKCNTYKSPAAATVHTSKDLLSSREIWRIWTNSNSNGAHKTKNTPLSKNYQFTDQFSVCKVFSVLEKKLVFFFLSSKSKIQKRTCLCQDQNIIRFQMHTVPFLFLYLKKIYICLALPMIIFCTTQQLKENIFVPTQQQNPLYCPTELAVYSNRNWIEFFSLSINS